MSAAKPNTMSPDWFSKTLAGALLGLTLAIGCAGLFNWLAGSMPIAVRGQLAMWLTAPVWMGVLSGVYFFRSGRRAWAWLGGANLLVFGALLATRSG
ncbi:MAG: hypothetical protein HYS20_12685 [Rhodocyclales bacterium]|nr:hypothetical protein [Rhodocyclales bacterium]